MRPVTPSRLDSVVERKEVCILSTTWFTIQFVSSLINHSPGNIATKQGNKRLPLELWREIIAWAEMDLKSGNYCLVQVHRLEERGAKRILSCAKITEWNRCGLLESEDAADEYRKHLRFPGEGDEPKRPFVLADTSNSDSLIRIEESLLLPENEILFYRLHVYDVVARIEHGDCSFCKDKRWVDYYGEQGGCRFYGGYFSSRPNYLSYFEDTTMGCPICIGLGARPIYDGPRTPQNDDQEEDLEAACRYDAEVKERFEKLGYDWVPSDFYDLE
ncbi:hypothetical protein LCI18_006647 [Fusarium solani-melongenae]|uniref:Uncharacterized protein n=1 Tax=Fusarium solani subsp. cucurbitae TaxID=2747967 RepID=A0ACD3Z3D2_FUSSC|nr:hypothetical protein LCI18_006647 [Fusarium solani-melongenae]